MSARVLCELATTYLFELIQIPRVVLTGVVTWKLVACNLQDQLSSTSSSDTQKKPRLTLPMVSRLT